MHKRSTAGSRFKHKALAALLAACFGTLGVHRVYLGLRAWWMPLLITLLCVPGLLVARWYQAPSFFIVMIPVVAGFVHALMLALMPDEKFDARYNAGCARKNNSGWDAVLVAIFTLGGGAIVVMTTFALLLQTLFESQVS